MERVAVDDFAFVRNTVTIEVTLRARGFSDEEVRLVLRREGAVVASATVRLGAAGTATVPLSFAPDETGTFVFTVAAPVFPGEAVAENNARSFVLRVIRDRVRVLLVAGRPSWDVRFLRGLLKRDPNVDLVSFFILRSNADDAGPQQDLSLIPFPVAEIFGNSSARSTRSCSSTSPTRRTAASRSSGSCRPCAVRPGRRRARDGGRRAELRRQPLRGDGDRGRAPGRPGGRLVDGGGRARAPAHVRWQAAPGDEPRPGRRRERRRLARPPGGDGGEPHARARARRDGPARGARRARGRTARPARRRARGRRGAHARRRDRRLLAMGLPRGGGGPGTAPTCASGTRRCAGSCATRDSRRCTSSPTRRRSSRERRSGSPSRRAARTGDPRPATA